MPYSFLYKCTGSFICPVAQTRLKRFAWPQIHDSYKPVPLLSLYIPGRCKPPVQETLSLFYRLASYNVPNLLRAKIFYRLTVQSKNTVTAIRVKLLVGTSPHKHDIYYVAAIIYWHKVMLTELCPQVSQTKSCVATDAVCTQQL